MGLSVCLSLFLSVFLPFFLLRPLTFSSSSSSSSSSSLLCVFFPVRGSAFRGGHKQRVATWRARGAPTRPTQEPPSVSVFPWRPHSPLTHPRTRAALTQAQDQLPTNPATVKAKRKPPHLAFLSFFFHPNPLKATVFFSPFCGFFFGQNLLTYRPQSQNLTKSPVFKS